MKRLVSFCSVGNFAMVEGGNPKALRCVILTLDVVVVDLWLIR